MATIAPESTKRKGFEENYDDICEISLFQPATKIRRLDAEFPTYMVERQLVVGYMHDEMSEGEIINVVPSVESIRSEPFLPPTENEERALVLYKPVYPSLKINPELISGIKNLSFWPRKGNTVREMCSEDDQSSSSNCLAVVPWVPSHATHLTAPATEVSTSRTEPLEEPMDAEMNGASMEIEDESFHQLMQHCMIPEMSQTKTSTPITWW